MFVFTDLEYIHVLLYSGIYEAAVYMSHGKMYLVEKLDLSNKTAFCKEDAFISLKGNIACNF